MENSGIEERNFGHVWAFLLFGINSVLVISQKLLNNIKLILLSMGIVYVL